MGGAVVAPGFSTKGHPASGHPSIVVYGGKILNAEGGTVKNTDVYRLTLASMKWDRVTDVPIGDVLQ